MSLRPISPLRQRMLEDMAVRKFGDKTLHDYTVTSRLSPASSAAHPTRQRPTTCAATKCT